jgi:Acyclic terpene utilisation family protein AtuA
MTSTRSMLRIANCSGFYGDRLSAAREMVEGGPIDVLTGDYLAELTMLILWKARQRDPDGGYAVSFLAQMRDVLGTCLERGIKIVVNAGGLNPAGLAAKLGELAAQAGLAPRIAHLEGDDLLPRLGELRERGEDFAHLGTGRNLADAEADGDVTPLTANAYLGAWGITEALRAGADVVICGRVTDAALVVGPSAWAFDWAVDDFDRLAGAVAAGHIVECGAQATGGNYAFFTEIGDPVRPGFPIAEMHADGSCVITKHPGTGGAVTVDTVTAQLLYEIDRPAYLNPDVVARFDTAVLTQEGPDRVRVDGVRGEAPPDTLKVCLNHHGGYRNSAVFVLTGLDLAAKARFAEASLLDAVGGRERFADFHTRTEACEGGARLTVTVKDPDEKAAGRALFTAIAGTGLSGYPGLHLEHASPRATEYGIYWPALVSADAVRPQVVMADGTRMAVPEPPRRARGSDDAGAGGGFAGDGFADGGGAGGGGAGDGGAVSGGGAGGGFAGAAAGGGGAYEAGGATARVPLGTLIGARSGDKGGDANVGLWARDAAAYAWLRGHLDTERLRTLLPESTGLRISRYELPNLRAVNFVVHGLLGDGVAASVRADPQAKSLGEYLRAQPVEIPISLLPDHESATDRQSEG